MKKKRSKVEIIEILEKSSIPFIFLGILCGFKEFLTIIVFQYRYDLLHIILSGVFTFIGVVLWCVARGLEYKEFNK